jgi:hypothetical protein
MTAAADDKAGGHVLNQSGLPPLVRAPTISYISFTAAVRPASRPSGAPWNGAVKSCRTKAVWNKDNVGMRGSLTWRVVSRSWFSLSIVWGTAGNERGLGAPAVFWKAPSEAEIIAVPADERLHFLFQGAFLKPATSEQETSSFHRQHRIFRWSRGCLLRQSVRHSQSWRRQRANR